MSRRPSTKKSGYTLDNFKDFLERLQVGYFVSRVKDTYVVTVYDKGSGRFRFQQRRFMSEDLQLLRSDIRNYLSSHKIKVEK